MKIKFFAKYIFLTTLLVVGVLHTRAAVDPPDLRCLSVDPASGDIIATWISPLDPLGEFINYNLYISTNPNGPYTLDGTINTIGTTTSTLASIAPGTHFVYVETVYDEGAGNVSVSSDTLATMNIQLSNITDTTATLTWNPVRIPMVPTHDNQYVIFQDFGATGTWTQIGTSPYGTETFDDVFKVCSENIGYRVEVTDASGCVNVSNEVVDLFQDITAPNPPFIDSVSVDTATGNIIIGWRQSSAGDTDGYIITYYNYLSPTPSYIAIDTLNGIGSINYLDTVANGNTWFHLYGVAAFDSCSILGNPNTSATNIEHQTMFLQSTLDYCRRENSVIWTPYIGWDTNLAGYDLYAEINSDTTVLVASLSADDTSFVHAGIDPLNSYCYFARAYTTGRMVTSTSNKFCMSAGNLVVPSHHYLKSVSIVENQFVNISCFVDTSIRISHYNIERSIRPDGPFLEIGTILPEQEPIVNFQDFEAEFEQTSFFYRVGMIDSCGDPLSYSNVSNTIHLKGNFDQFEFHNYLNWTPYADWLVSGNGVEKYEVYRKLNGLVEPNPSFTITTGEFSLIDSLMSTYMTTGKEVCFVVQAVESQGNLYGFRERSFSNELCFTTNPIIWIPNAFAPEGINNEFKPVISFGDWTAYSLQVFDRYGQLLFESNQQDVGWNGYVGTRLAAIGNYVYRITINNSTGDQLQRTGVVTLVR